MGQLFRNRKTLKGFLGDLSTVDMQIFKTHVSTPIKRQRVLILSLMAIKISQMDPRHPNNPHVTRFFCERSGKTDCEDLYVDVARLGSSFEPGSVEALIAHHDPDSGSPIEKTCEDIARALKDDGFFGMDIFSRRGRPALPPWHDLCALLCNAGLWIDGHYLYFAAPLGSRHVRLRPGLALPLAHRVALTGTRISRKVATMRNDIVRALATDGRAESISAGMSMSPTFRSADRLIFAPCHRPRKGDIVLMQGKTCLLVHRVWATLYKGNTGWIVHRGDSPAAKPTLAARWRVIGKVIEIDKYGK